MAACLSEFKQFVSGHNNQLLSAKIPEIYWKTLYTKLNEEVFDANNYFTLVYDEQMELYPAVTCEDGIKNDNPESIFLIDHAWTYEAEYARVQLKSVHGLAKRMANLMNLLETGNENGFHATEDEDGNSGEKPDAKIAVADGFRIDRNGHEVPNDDMVERIFQNMWRFNQTYLMQIMRTIDGETSNTLKEQISLWYIMDEFGSKIRHSDNPTWHVRSFYFQNNGVLFSVMFPTRDLNYGDAVTRDFAAGVTDPAVRVAVLYPWHPEAFNMNENANMDINIDDILFSSKERAAEVCTEELPGVDYIPKKDHYNVFTDVPAVAKSLRETKFQLVDDPENADILWATKHIKDFRPYQESGSRYINQFPFENILTCKDLLSRVVERVGILYPDSTSESSTRPVWFQQSFNLNLELPQFVRNFHKKRERNEDNIWIIKPWNLGRSMDTHVSRDLNHIIRLRETGPKIAFKYIHNPVLLDRENVGKVKFHFRYMPAVTCIEPLIIHVDEVFWIGCANKTFSLDDFHVYEKHFTTMNYRSDVQLKQVHYNEFIEMFDKQYPGYKWSDMEKKVHKIIRELFEAASSEPSPRGIRHCKVSRAYYALDFMLKWADDGSDEMQPVLLEVNYNPDCDRLVKFYPDSFNHLFTSLFLGEKTPWSAIRL